MERPGFNPQAPAHSLGRQRSGANKNKKKAAQRVRRRARAGGRKGEAKSVRECHGWSVWLGGLQHIFRRWASSEKSGFKLLLGKRRRNAIGSALCLAPSLHATSGSNLTLGALV